jgi:hypothetical protein
MAQISDTAAEKIVRTIVTTIDFTHGLTYEVLRSAAGFRAAPTQHEREFLLALVRLSVVAGESRGVWPRKADTVRHKSALSRPPLPPNTNTFPILTQGSGEARVRRYKAPRQGEDLKSMDRAATDRVGQRAPPKKSNIERHRCIEGRQCMQESRIVLSGKWKSGAMDAQEV